MRRDRLALDLDALSVESFAAGDMVTPSFLRGDSELIYTVLGPTEAVSCGGTCGTCGGTDCWV